MTHSAADLLRMALQAHDVPVRVAGERLHVDQDQLDFEPRVFHRPPLQGRHRLQLDIHIHSSLLGSGVIVESFAGLDDDAERATAQAFGKFLLGTLHVALEGLGSHRCEPPQVEWEQWQAATHGWRVCSGVLLTQGESPGPYDGFMQSLQELFTRSIGPGAHWVRVFMASYDGKCQAVEVLLDNEPWPQAQALLGSWPWRYPAGYSTLRHFLVALPAQSPEAAA